MKKLFFIFLLICTLVSGAQTYNNEWIDYSKTYYKIKVGKNGLYRIPQAALSAMGIAAVDVAQFQLWRNGIEVPVYTSSPSGNLDALGYIEFWGEMNDGKADLPLYRIADHQLCDKWSLYSDTSVYFLTINASGANKRLQNTANIIPSGAIPQPYFIHTLGKYYKDQIHLGYPQGSGSEALYSSSYEYGEGWASNPVGNNETLSYVANNLFVYTGADAPDIKVKMNVAGDAANVRKTQLSLNGNLLFDNQLTAYNFSKLNTTAPVALVSSNTANFIFTNSNTTTSIDRVKVAAIELSYPRSFNFGGSSNFEFELPAKATGTYLEISGFNFSGIPVLYDVNNGKRYEVNAANPALLKVFLQPTLLSQHLVLVNESAANINTITQFETKNFVNYLQADKQGDYLIITNNAILADGNGGQPVEAYRAYRAAVEGGAFNAKVYMADQLMDQFAYGIKNHTSGIRNFVQWARSTYTKPLKFVFLIGKGVSYYWAKNNESDPLLNQLNLVPTFGYPASDILLTATGGSSLPLTPVGRLSVINGNELNIYLDKVKEYEQQYTSQNGIIADQLWKKNVAHMVGADDAYTINLLYGYLNQHKKIIEDTLFGANANDFVKGSSGSAQQLNAERLTMLINKGIGLLTYFGHASTTTLGFNLENPQNYNNKSKYPIFNMMGCNVGNIFGLEAGRASSLETVSEKYILAKDRGAIAMMAGTSLGYVNTLEEYNRSFYTQLSTANYGRSVGELMNATIKTLFDKNTENDLLLRSQCETHTLHGDPAIKLYQQNKPDYAIEDAAVVINPAFISVAEKSFTVKATIANLGKAVNKKLVVTLKRTFPDMSVKIFKTDTIDAIRYTDSLTYQLPIDPIQDKGLNKISIVIDPDNAIDELNKSNNIITKDLYIYEDEIRPVYPYEYSIVNNVGKLIATTANPFAAARNYVIEVDTTLLFNSPLKTTQTKNAVGGIIEFAPGIIYQNNKVYYWRVASVPAMPTEAYKWNASSFLYLNGTTTGFNQSHHYQFSNNIYNNMQLNDNGGFAFSERKASVNITTAIYPYGTQASNYHLLINDSLVANSWIAPFAAQTNSLRFYVINNKLLEVLKNQDLGTSGLYGSYRPEPYYPFVTPNYFQFDISTVAARETVMNFLDAIPNDYYIIATNSIYASTILPQVWQNDTTVLGLGRSLYHKFVQMGASRIGEVTSFVPFIFVMQKGKTVAVEQEIATLPTQLLSLTTTITGLAYTANMETPPIGPAKQWNKIIYTGNAGPSAKAEVTVTVIGIQKDGTATTLLQNIVPGITGVDISTINAATYPKLKLKLNTMDSVSSTPYALNQWQVLYTPIPEGAVAPNIYFTGKDTLDVGEPLNIGIAFKNISDYNFDPLQVKLSVRNRNNVESIVEVPQQKALAAGDTIQLTVPVNTAAYTGRNTLFLEFNPNNAQPEQYGFNNFIYKDFYVRGDTTNPYMDVTFDGLHILNKDIVSAKPDILMKLTDDSKWLLLNNASLIKVQLKHPDGGIRNYDFNSDTLVFNEPSSANNNTATVNFKPTLLKDGVYELMITAKDQSGNTAGMQYRVQFQVINKPMISNLLNYPNPFTTSTAFVFTLTGSEVPQNIRIQILTITGKIVKEITKAELGAINIGRNITTYKWDGTDQFGQQLANGVYIYRVLTNLNGKSLDKYKAENDNTDKYFNKGYGKMYLMR